MRLLSWKYFSTYKLRIFPLTSHFPSLLTACVTFTFWYVLEVHCCPLAWFNKNGMCGHGCVFGFGLLSTFSEVGSEKPDRFLLLFSCHKISFLNSCIVWFPINSSCIFRSTIQQIPTVVGRKQNESGLLHQKLRKGLDGKGLGWGAVNKKGQGLLVSYHPSSEAICPRVSQPDTQTEKKAGPFLHFPKFYPTSL